MSYAAPVLRGFLPIAVVALSPAAHAASFELTARASQSPTVAPWRQATTVRVLLEMVIAADEADVNAEAVVARDVSLVFHPTRVVRRAEVLGYPAPPSGQPLDLFLGNVSTVLLRLATAPASEGPFRLGELRVVHQPSGSGSRSETRRDLWLTFVIDPETRAKREAKAEEDASDELPAAASAADEEPDTDHPTGIDEPVEPQMNERVEARAAAVEAELARLGTHAGNPAAPTSLATCLREQSFDLIIDPGHDVDDPRANRTWEDFSEFELNEVFAERLAARVSAGLPRLRATLSRAPNEVLPLPERARAITAKGADLVVSIHHDNVGWSRQNARRIRGDIVRTCDDHIGFSIYVGTTRGGGDEARRAARFVADGLLAAGRLPGRFYSWGDSEHGVYNGDGLYLLRNLAPPSILVEVGYMCNPAELRQIQSRRFVDQQTRAIADAIRRYVLSSRCTSVP